MPVPQGTPAVDRHLLRDTAYTRLRDAIVAGTLAPGEELHDGELCSWLGLSRTPVRDALSRLKDERLIEMAPQRYTRVTKLALADVRETVPILAVLHALAVELAVPRLPGAALPLLQSANEAFVTALRARDAPAAYAADDRFHEVFVAACGNAEIGRSVERLTPRLHRLEHLCRGVLPGRRSVAQHQAITSRAATRDAAAAASATRENWLTLGAVLERSFS